MTGPAFDRILDALRAAGRKVERSGATTMAQCPAHDDGRPSLSLTHKDGKGVLLHCFAGCEPGDIVAALGLSAGDLFDAPAPTRDEWLPNRLQFVAAYDYTDANGNLVFQVLRGRDAAGGKQFLQRHPDSTNRSGWCWKLAACLGDRRHLPYRLPELVDGVRRGVPVWIAEGEKDVDALRRLGVVATCNAGGAGKWRPEHAAWLKGAHVVIVRDMDEPGRQHQQVVARTLAGVAASVRLVEPATGKDAADHVAAGMGLADFVDADSPSAAEPIRVGALGRLLADLREWQHLPDPTHVVATLAVAATRGAEGEPCWLLLVAPPSSGKTEAVRVLDDTADARLDEVTAAGLLGWTKGKTATPSGVLTRCGPRALATFGDLSGLLATSDRGGRDQVFALLRRAYDGHVSRDVAPPGAVSGNARLEWSGRLTVVACVTGAIDRYAAHSDQLGARWLYCRIPERTLAEKRHAAALARRGGLAEKRQAAREAVVRILEAARVPDSIPEELAAAVEDAALVTAWGRAAVPRNGYGRREIEGVPIVEEPMRLVQQLGGVGAGVLALGLPVDAAVTVCRRLALDSMPAARHAVLAALSSGEVLSTAGVARVAGLDRKVARFQLEELAAVGVVENDRDEDESDELVGAVHWSLSGDEGAVIAEVFAAERAAGGWDETWVSTTPPPPNRDGDIDRQPTLRPTPDRAPTAVDADVAPCPLHPTRPKPDGCFTCAKLAGRGVGRVNPLEDLARVLSAALESDERPPCTYPDTGALWLSESREERAEGRQDAETVAAILDALADRPEGWSGEDLQRVTGRKDAALTRVRDALVKDGTLAKDRRPGRGGGFLYRLNTEPPEPPENPPSRDLLNPPNPPLLPGGSDTGGLEPNPPNTESGRTCADCGRPVAAGKVRCPEHLAAMNRGAA